MVRGSLQRAAMAILLMGLIIAPLGICLHQSARGVHSCCMQTESSDSVRTNCCIVRVQLPATVAASAVPDSSPVEVLHEPAVNMDAPATDKHPAVAVAPPLSPQPGAFILRI
jgi:hypothetical protein